jgi:hypothetical protein
MVSLWFLLAKFKIWKLMNFKKLTKEQQENLYTEFLSSATSLGGKNRFLKMVESVKIETESPLLNKERNFKFSNGKISWNKSIYKDTLHLLHNSMKKEEKDGDIFIDLNPKDYKAVMNMVRTLKPIQITFQPKNYEDGNGFILAILDTSENRKTKVTTLFKAIFLYHIAFIKEVLSFKSENCEITSVKTSTLNTTPEDIPQIKKDKKKKRTREYKVYVSKADR